MRLGIMVSDAIVWDVVDAIRQQAWTGEHVEGKIYVLDVVDAVRIRTNERGEAAVWTEKEHFMDKIKLVLLVMMLTMLSGCAESSALIRANNTSIRTDIFQELTNGGTVPEGMADLHFTATLKTHRPGIYSSKDIHGTPDYKILLNIDGQAMQLQGILHEENSARVRLVDPEAGDGIRYRFSKRMRLRAGAHRIVVAIPDEEIAVQKEISLVQGAVNNLVLEPVYSTVPGNKRLGINNTTRFMKGIRDIRLMLNGRDI